MPVLFLPVNGSNPWSATAVCWLYADGWCYVSPRCWSQPCSNLAPLCLDPKFVVAINTRQVFNAVVTERSVSCVVYSSISTLGKSRPTNNIFSDVFKHTPNNISSLRPQLWRGKVYGQSVARRSLYVWSGLNKVQGLRAWKLQPRSHSTLQFYKHLQIYKITKVQKSTKLLTNLQNSIGTRVAVSIVPGRVICSIPGTAVVYEVYILRYGPANEKHLIRARLSLEQPLSIGYLSYNWQSL